MPVPLRQIDPHFLWTWRTLLKCFVTLSVEGDAPLLLNSSPFRYTNLPLAQHHPRIRTTYQHLHIGVATHITWHTQ